jgi:hypothetical protein
MELGGPAVDNVEQDLSEIEVHTLRGIGSRGRFPYAERRGWTPGAFDAINPRP